MVEKVDTPNGVAENKAGKGNGRIYDQRRAFKADSVLEGARLDR